MKGNVYLERDGAKLPVPVGTVIKTGDTVITQSDGSIGITFFDNSLLSAGPNSVLSIDKFMFDTTTHEGVFESTLKKGTLAAVSGKIVKHTPEAMKIRTPSAIMGVRGTEFVVRVDEP
ncbi:MAG TPA: FecR domain-containing protein [Chitinophagaceae bacterium]